jgi:hypothetical protein
MATCSLFPSLDKPITASRRSVGDRPIEGAFRRRSHAFSAQEIHLQAGTAHHDITRRRDRLKALLA